MNTVDYDSPECSRGSSARGQLRVKLGHEIEALAASVELHIAAEIVAAPRLSAQCH